MIFLNLDCVRMKVNQTDLVKCEDFPETEHYEQEINGEDLFEDEQAKSVEILENIRCGLSRMLQVEEQIKTEKALILRAERKFFAENVLRIRGKSSKEAQENQDNVNRNLQRQLLSGRFDNAYIQVHQKRIN